MEINFHLIGCLRQQISKIEELESIELIHSHWKDWSAPTKALLTLLLGRKHVIRQEFKKVCKQVDKLDGSKKRKARLPDLKELLKSACRAKVGSDNFSRKVFIVHGHNKGVSKQLVGILKSLKFDPIVLMQETGKGKTIIEQIEKKAAEAGFGFIIYSPDDQGGADGEKLRPRARQNVVFEHGYLMGLMGRDRTCALITTDDIEKPSDIGGLIYERINDSKLEHD
jgi:predicted nucleotide-binding protein